MLQYNNVAPPACNQILPVFSHMYLFIHMRIQHGVLICNEVLILWFYEHLHLHNVQHKEKFSRTV